MYATPLEAVCFCAQCAVRSLCRITCVIWEKNQCKKVDLSVAELGGQIERQVAKIDYDSTELFFCSVTFTFLIALSPFLFRFYYSPKLTALVGHLSLDNHIPDAASLIEARNVLLGSTWQVRDIEHPYRLSMYIWYIYFTLSERAVSTD